MMASNYGSGNNGANRKGRSGKRAYGRLSHRRKAFVLNYLKMRMNGTRAYLASYDPEGTKKMSEHTAGSAAARLLGDSRIQAAIAEAANDALCELELDVERVLRGVVAHGLLPLTTWVSWDENGVLTLKAPEDLPPELWLPIKKIKTKHVRTPKGNIKVDQEVEISRSDPMLEVLADVFRLIPPRKIGVGLSRDTATDRGETPKLPGEHGYPPMPATIAEWEAQVRAANIARAMEDAEGTGGQRDRKGKD